MLRNLLIIVAYVFLFSCQSHAEGIKPSKKILDKENRSREWYKKYRKGDYDEWQKLKLLLKDHLINAKEADIIDCRGFDRNSDKLFFHQKVIYTILGKSYSWHIYNTKNGRCIERAINNVGTFFLDKNEAITLLTASLGHNFNKLNLQAPKIAYKYTKSQNHLARSCSDTTSEYVEDKLIISNNCEEHIYYGQKN